MLDGAHAEADAKNLANYLKNIKVPKYAIWAMMKNKEPDLFIKHFKGIFKKIITIPIENKKCFQDFDCGMNGFCQSSSVGDNYCSFTKSELILGKYNEEFFEGYFGDIYLNFD